MECVNAFLIMVIIMLFYKRYYYSKAIQIVPSYRANILQEQFSLRSLSRVCSLSTYYPHLCSTSHCPHLFHVTLSLPLTYFLYPPTSAPSPLTSVSRQVLHFVCQVRTEHTQSIPLSNRSSRRCTLKPVLQGEHWSAPLTLVLEPGQQNKPYEITYKPLVMTADGRKHQVCKLSSSSPSFIHKFTFLLKANIDI